VAGNWDSYFTALVGASAALTGLVFVAISINLSRIIAYPFLPSRAGEALIGPVGAITATSLVLIPDQPVALAGAELAAVGLVMVLAPILIQARTWSARKDATATERAVRAITSWGVGLLFVIGGALLTGGYSDGFYWIAAGSVASVIAVFLNSWILMIEILR